MMIRTCKLTTRERLYCTFFLHRLQWNRFPTGSGIQSHLFKICTRQFLQNAPDVLVNLEAFKKCWFTVTTKHSEAAVVYVTNPLISKHSISVCKVHKWLSSSKQFSDCIRIYVAAFIENKDIYNIFQQHSCTVSCVSRQSVADENIAYLQTGQRHSPRSQFNCRYESRSKHCKCITKCWQ